MTVSDALLMAAAGGLLSLLFSYTPGLRVKYASLSEEEKQLIMLMALLLVAGGVVASSCLNLWVFMSCDKVGLMKLAEAFVAALMGNQSVYKLTPKTTDVKMLKEAKG